MSTLFISDLHLCSGRPGINRGFFGFIEREAKSADALYILGDLFEYWAGDDDLGDPFNATVVAALARLVGSGVPAYLMHGNRDFVIGEAFAHASMVTLLPDPTLLSLYGQPTLLMHGDTLCTLDREYQAFRRKARSDAWIRNLLGKPLTERKAAIEALRRQSEQEKRNKPEEIMDVDPAEVEATFRRHGYPRLIHGHTHRPARHVHMVDGHACERWVLADWYQAGSYLACDESGCHAVQLSGN
ncbi:MAG: UDP-2,3-diacylglucosamine diphosphatase [Betaproteobacteria bacterium]|nr:MAG: UDP-2,3-diacylglucosamine diphosphatase [Betaproteobacteria bacterium]